MIGSQEQLWITCYGHHRLCAHDVFHTPSLCFSTLKWNIHQPLLLLWYCKDPVVARRWLPLSLWRHQFGGWRQDHWPVEDDPCNWCGLLPFFLYDGAFLILWTWFACCWWKTEIPNQFALITTSAVANKSVMFKTMSFVKRDAFKIQTIQRFKWALLHNIFELGFCFNIFGGWLSWE